ncbi:MAG: 4Fe-4S dicluster domain-containing protein [Planctomycetota bacterium]
MIETLRDTCRQLLRDGKVDVIIGYGQDPVGQAFSPSDVAQAFSPSDVARASSPCSSTQARCPGSDADGPVFPVFIQRPEDVDQLVWNNRCYANLSVYLKRPEIRALGRPAVVVKGCDQRALVVLEKESQLDRSQVHVIGMACDSMNRPKCETCDVHEPRGTDVVIGKAASNTNAISADQRYSAINAFLARSSSERLAYWRQELARCVKCYACRQVCPMCYCPRCIVDKNRPQVISTSATLKGNFAWHITRAFHLAARCVGCEECTRVCPMGIDLRLLNLSLAQAAEENFAFRAGDDPQAEPVVGSYALQDKESFIQ